MISSARASVVAVLLVAGAAAAGPPADPLDKPSFTATPAELLAAAKKVGQPAEPVVVLREDETFTVDDHHRVVDRWRLVFVVHTQAGADGWQMLEREWHTAFQDQPEVRARVIDPSGAVHELDPGGIQDEASSVVRDGESERHRFDAQLPAIPIGSVVEEQLIVRDREPSLPAGTIARFALSVGSPHASTRVVFDAPAALHAHVATRGLPKVVHAGHEVRGGREVWTFGFDALPAAAEAEPEVPLGDVEANLALATAPSWQAVAKSYREILEAKLAAGPVTLPATLPHTPTRDAAIAITAWMQKQVRSTTLAPPDSWFVPRPPADTLKRGAGDDPDLAVLLVALLRQAGFTADVVLVDTDTFTQPDLPGIDLFDRTIVRARAGGVDLYIDPALDAGRAGQLPANEQGRYALVVADDATALGTTPAAAAADNVIREVRTFELSDYGKARVTEVSHEGGVFEQSLRIWFRDGSHDQIKKQLESYIQQRYSSDHLATFSSSPPDDLATPFETTLVAADAPRGTTERETATVMLYPRHTLERLSDVLSPDGDDPPPPRTHDYVFRQPYVYEIENRIVFPAGFQIPAPAAPAARELGTMHFTEQQRVEGRTLVVTFRLDTGKTRLTPAEVEATRKAVAELRGEDRRIEAAPEGWALVQDGKYKEAIAAAQRAVAAHPRQAVQYTRLAEVLLQMGAGTAARRAARKAVELAPKDADASVVLGFILMHDTLGRRFGFDYDRAGAIAALEKARKLDPNHLGGAIELAHVLEVSPFGRRFDPGADLRGAAAAWRTAYELEKSDDHGIELARTLLFMGDGAGAEKVLQELGEAELRDHLLLSAAWMTGGLAEARRVADSLATGDARATLLRAAAGVLVGFRRYDGARELLAEAGGASTPQLADVFKKLAIQQVPKLPTRDPGDAARAMFCSITDPAQPKAPYWDSKTGDEVYTAAREELGQESSTKDLVLPVLDDVVLSLMELKIEGDSGLWRVEGTEAGKRATLYVALQGAAAKVIGTADAPQGAARHVLRLLAKHDDQDAAKLLDWLAKDVVSRDENARTVQQFTNLWGPGLPRDRGESEIAAIVLADDTIDPAPTITPLGRCGATTAAGQEACDEWLADEYTRLHDWRTLDQDAKEWADHAPATDRGFAIAVRLLALAHLKRFDEADKLLADAEANIPHDVFLQHASVELELARGHLDKAVAEYTKLLADHWKPFALNNMAWLQLAAGIDLPGALHIAHSVADGDKAKPQEVDTLAALEAEVGDLHAARLDAVRAMDVGHRVKPEASDWYVAGRIFELAGLRDDAIAAYRRTSAPQHAGLEWMPTSYDLAQRRLKALGTR